MCSWCFGFRRVSLYSTTATVSGAGKSKDSLYRRISPIGDPRVSIVPVLDQWIEEGRKVYKDQLQNIIKQLRRYRRFKHALEVSQWMIDIRDFSLSSRDIAVRMDLISKVHGMKQAENYFNNIPEQLKLMETYSAVLNCYAQEKSVEKADEIMQKSICRNLKQLVREFGFANSPKL
ncbi:hypothetical protein F0562_017321 [Nyssa sinensis]|uniref:Pentacotripeptide-repeat region of PRORP domain-containing protein n=1 Tax=Nyssa sinensis TaxID=561372 RepID=A0A5J4ZI39_9ASTE|nr:hypothetical protein F0562_017321 [Nyssa sinensis]